MEFGRDQGLIAPIALFRAKVSQYSGMSYGINVNRNFARAAQRGTTPRHGWTSLTLDPASGVFFLFLAKSAPSCVFRAFPAWLQGKGNNCYEA